MEVKHLGRLGTNPVGDTNEDREVPLTMHGHTHIHTLCNVSLSATVGRVIDHKEESLRTNEALMWSDGRGKTRTLTTTTDRQEEESKEERGTKMGKINIAEGNMEI